MTTNLTTLAQEVEKFERANKLWGGTLTGWEVTEHFLSTPESLASIISVDVVRVTAINLIKRRYSINSADWSFNAIRTDGIVDLVICPSLPSPRHSYIIPIGTTHAWFLTYEQVARIVLSIVDPNRAKSQFWASEDWWTLEKEANQ